MVDIHGSLESPDPGDVNHNGSAIEGQDAPLLSVEALCTGYPGFPVIEQATFGVHNREIVGLLGPNGAGKTTLMKSIAGLIKVTSGRVVFDGLDVSQKKAHQRARLGLTLIPERKGTFRPLTVGENLSVQWRAADSEILDKVHEVFPILRGRMRQRAATLSGGEAQMLSIARAYIARPSLLMVDEISTGLAPKVVEQCFDQVLELHALGTAVIIVDQYIERLTEICDRLLVVAGGRLVFSGKPSDVEMEGIWRYFRS